jgi:hypothetical protein
MYNPELVRYKVLPSLHPPTREQTTHDLKKIFNPKFSSGQGIFPGSADRFLASFAILELALDPGVCLLHPLL